MTKRSWVADRSRQMPRGQAAMVVVALALAAWVVTALAARLLS